MLILSKCIKQFLLIGVCPRSNLLISQIHRSLLSTSSNTSLSPQPGFTGAQVENYIKLTRFCSQLHFFDRAFPPPNDNTQSIFEQCPPEFPRVPLYNFISTCRSKEGRKLFAAASLLQEQTVKCWNPKSDEPTLSMYLSILGIDEAASKECGMITLDLHLRAGVLIEEGGADGHLHRITTYVVSIYLVMPKQLRMWLSLNATYKQGKSLTQLPIFKERYVWRPCLVFVIFPVTNTPELICSLLYSIWTLTDSWTSSKTFLVGSALTRRFAPATSML